MPFIDSKITVPVPAEKKEDGTETEEKLKND